jgi:CheY-like chemotaxis protein
LTKVLFADDDEHQRTLYEEILEDAGLQVVVAASAEEGLAKISHLLPDVVVLDIVMPGKDGIDCMGNILDRLNTLPIVLHTAYTHYQDNFMTWCAEAYVTKSSNSDELIQAIRNVAKSSAPPAPN